MPDRLHSDERGENIQLMKEKQISNIYSNLDGSKCYEEKESLGKT